jgi:hypothetical protein
VIGYSKNGSKTEKEICAEILINDGADEKT